MARKTKEELLEERTQRDWEKAHGTAATPTAQSGGASVFYTDPPVEQRPRSAAASVLYRNPVIQPAPAVPLDKPIFAPVQTTGEAKTVAPTTETPIVTPTETSKGETKEEVAAPKTETPAATDKGNGLSVQIYPGGTLAGYVDEGVFNEETLNSYLAGLSAINNAETAMSGSAPTYQGTYDAQLNAAYNKIVGRDPFQYDIANDPMYQQYAEQYMRRGALAAEDVMGEAAAMTGGYGNSYAATVGNQTYQNYLQNINDMIPEFYGMALDRYNAEGDALEKEYSMLRDLADREHEIYQDELDNYWKGVEYEQDLADRAYDRNQAVRDQITTLIGYGYVPTDEELSAVGMTRAEADIYANVYAEDKASASAEAVSANRKNLIDDISIGYMPTDEEIAAAGMTRELADAYAAYFANESEAEGETEAEDSPEMKIIKAALSQFVTGDDVYNYLVGLVESGTIDEKTANELYAEYYIPEELPIEQRKWEAGSSDAYFIDNYGREYGADELAVELVKIGMSKDEAAAYVRSLYDEFFGYDEKKFNK